MSGSGGGVITRLEQLIARWRLRHRSPDVDAALLPHPDLPAGTDTLPQIEHVVVLMMENHSFDNYFGMLDHGDGLPRDATGAPVTTNPGCDGTEVPLRRFGVTTQAHGVPSQSWRASHIQYGDGANDGFVQCIETTIPGAPRDAGMGYWAPEDLPFYAGLARTFPLADRWFSSCLGPTFPNRRFLLAGTANGLIDDIAFGMFDYPRGGSLFDVLERHGISWRNYHHTSSTKAAFKRLLGGHSLNVARRVLHAIAGAFPQFRRDAMKNMQFTADLYPAGLIRCLTHLRPISRFWSDVAAGDLPAVTIVDPDFTACSEENPQDVRQGEAFAAKVVDAVMHGPAWPRTVLIWVYDEHGGYYDHVPPPAAPEPDDVRAKSLLTPHGPIRWVLERLHVVERLEAIDLGTDRYDRLGIRVPAVVVSPWAKPGGYVSHETYDHTSILKLIERKWNLPPLTRRDFAAADPSDMLDLDTPAFLEPPTLPPSAVPWQPAET